MSIFNIDDSKLGEITLTVVTEGTVYPIGKIAGITICLVNGDSVRDVEVEFALGGNWKRYPDLIPPMFVWIEDTLRPRDQCITIIHELPETAWMVTKGYDYDRAHNMASELEKAARREIHTVTDVIQDAAKFLLKAGAL